MGRDDQTLNITFSEISNSINYEVGKDVFIDTYTAQNQT